MDTSGFLINFVPPATLSPGPISTYTRVRNARATSDIRILLKVGSSLLLRDSLFAYEIPMEDCRLDNRRYMWLNKGRSFARAVLPGRLLLWQAERALKKRTRYLTGSEASLALALYLMSIKSAHGRWIALDHLVKHSRLMNEYSLMSTLASREVLDHLVEGTLTAYGRLPGEYQASPIPKDYWHYRCFHIEQDDGSLWKISLTDRDNIGEERKATLPEYTELLFNSAEFESQFPMHDPATEVAIGHLLEQASVKGLVVPVLLSK
jgi:hypothetical protein